MERPKIEIISLRQYAYENNLTKRGVVRQIKEGRLPEHLEGRLIDSTWIIIKWPVDGNT